MAKEFPKIRMQEDEWVWEKMVSLFGKVEFETPVEHLSEAITLAASFELKALCTNVGKRCRF